MKPVQFRLAALLSACLLLFCVGCQPTGNLSASSQTGTTEKTSPSTPQTDGSAVSTAPTDPDNPLVPEEPGQPGSPETPGDGGDNPFPETPISPDPYPGGEADPPEELPEQPEEGETETISGSYDWPKIEHVVQVEDGTDQPIREGFHDQSSRFMNPIAPAFTDAVTLRVRIPAKAAVSGSIMYSKYADTDNTAWSEVPLTFDEKDETGYYEYWKGTIPAQKAMFRYRFKLVNKAGTYYVMPHGTSERASASNIRDFLVMPGFDTPAWSQGATYYSIMPDSFFNGDPNNDPRYENGVQTLASGANHRGLNDWFGGDFVGIQKKMDYITKYIGANAIALNPVWESGSVAGYGPTDMNMVNASFGSEETLKALIRDSHSAGARVVLDVVLAYYSTSSPYYNANNHYPLPGAASGADNRFSPFFAFTTWPNYIETWGLPQINFDAPFAQELLYKTPDSFLQRYVGSQYQADGYRFDVGNTLYGSTRNEHEILKDLRSYIKAANPNAVFMSEHASSEDLFDYTLDSKWNYDFSWPLMSWAANGLTQTDLADTLYNAVLRLPRPIALSSYNFISVHDETRLIDKLGGDVAKYKAAQLLLMTYLGSPVIYYGDETGLTTQGEITSPDGSVTADSRFGSMNWDKAAWNMEITNLYRALCELRNTHSALRDGTFEMLDTDDLQMVFAFARYDDASKVIVLTSQNPNDCMYQVNARRIGAKNGEIFTNWLTGEQYMVDKDGMLTVKLHTADGGAILVRGGQESSSFRRSREMAAVGKTTASIASSLRYTDDARSILVANNGSIATRLDSFTMMGQQATNNFQYVAKLEKLASNSRAALMVRDGTEGSSAAYFTIVDGKRLSIYARKAYNGKAELLGSYNFGADMWILISRENGNTFRTYAAYDKDGKPETWYRLEKSVATVQMAETVWAGATGIKGAVQFSDPILYRTAAQYGDPFDGSVPGSLFTAAGNPAWSLKDGHLLLAGDKRGSQLRAQAPYQDFSVRVKLDNAPAVSGQASWLTVGVDGDEHLKAGRRFADGKVQLIFAREQAGTQQVYALVEDIKPDSPVYFQIQRTGVSVAAYYSYDAVIWKRFASPVHYNASELTAGVMAAGTGHTAQFDTFTFGNFAQDAATGFNTPVSEKTISIATADSAPRPLGNWKIYSGDWDYCVGGFIQKSTAGSGAMGLENRPIQNNLYLETSLSVKGSGWAGIGFRLQNPAKGVSDGGYLVRVYADGRLELIAGSSVIAAVTAAKPLFADGMLRLVITHADGMITVKGGLNNQVLLQVQSTAYTGGLCGYYTYKAEAEFHNYKFMNDLSSWETYSGASLSGSRINTSGLMCWATLKNQAFTNFVVSADIDVYGPVTASTEVPESGFQIAKTASYTPRSGGILVGFNDRGELFIRNDNVTVAKAKVSDVEKNRVTLAVVDGFYTVFLGDSNKPVLTWQSPVKGGGALQFYSINSGGYFDNIQLEPLNAGETYTASSIYRTLH